MKIKFLSGPRTGQTDHAPNTQETQLLAKAGIIEIIPYRDYRDRLADEISAATVQPVVEWGTCVKNDAALVVKKIGADTYYVDAPTADTPDSIKVQFARLQTQNSAAQFAANAAERSRAEEAQRHEMLAEMNRR
jgi:hypothetical protein